jgi:hypothetical protein
MEIQFFSFPMQQDGILAMEKALAYLERREQTGEALEPEVQDWMEYAANVIYKTNQIIISG